VSRDRAGEQNLEALLQDWAARHALLRVRAETIRQAVLVMPETPATELTVAWWHRLFRPLAATLQRSTDMARYLQPDSLSPLNHAG
jgi:hypothetical protein